MKRLRRAPRTLLLLCVALLAGTARADPPRIALDRAGLSTPTVAQILAELEALGFEVADADAAPSASIAATVRAASGGVEVSVRGRRARVLADPALGADDPSVVIRAVELLRASLLEVRAADPTAPPPPPAPPSRTSPPTWLAPLPLLAASPPRLAVEGAPALLLSPGGTSAAPALLLGVGWAPSSFVGAGAFLLVPVLPARVSVTEGAARLRPVLLGAGVRLSSPVAGGRLLPAAELGLAVAWLHTSGEAEAPYVGHVDDRAAAAPYVRAALAIPLRSHLALRADLLGGVLLPPARVAIADRLAARWGAPFFAPSIGCAIALP
jgi:hypothetical protein